MTGRIWEPEGISERLPEARSEDFVDLFTAQYAKLVGVLRVAGAERSTAEDVAQEAFARTLNHWRRVRNGTNPAGYVYRVAFRLLQRRSTALRESPLDDVDEVRSTAPSTDDTAITNLTARAALDDMPPRRRACAALCWYLGFTSEEAGAILGVDATTVRKQLERARRRGTAATLG